MGPNLQQQLLTNNVPCDQLKPCLLPRIAWPTDLRITYVLYSNPLSWMFPIIRSPPVIHLCGSVIRLSRSTLFQIFQLCCAFFYKSFWSFITKSSLLRAAAAEIDLRAFSRFVHMNTAFQFRLSKIIHFSFVHTTVRIFSSFSLTILSMMHSQYSSAVGF